MTEIDEITLKEEQKVLIEKIGVFYEQSGHTPAASRIIGLLLVSDKIELSFDHIRNALNMSKSATSTSLNALLAIDYIEYITKPGERKRYFKNKVSKWSEATSKRLEGVLYLANLLKEVLDSRPKETEAYNKDLAELVDFLFFLKEEFGGVFEKWKKSRM